VGRISRVRRVRASTTRRFAIWPRPAETSRLFIDAVVLALVTHTAVAYGGMRQEPQAQRGGLAPWQVRRVTALIDAEFTGSLRIAELAKACGLSASYFVQAFKKSIGMTPHRWLMRRRVEKARELLRKDELPVADIAIACGFANQSHFTRVFGAAAGCPPAEWRRRVQPVTLATAMSYVA
jgi:AraC family transcriptional regulator